MQPEQTKDTNNRPNLLLLGARVPFPLISGERLKNFHLVERLSRHFNLHLIFLSDEKDNSKAEEALTPYASSLRIFQVSPWRQRLNALKAIIGRSPLQVAYFHSAKVQAEVDRILPSMDVAVATLVRTASYLKDARIPKILDMADSIGLNYRDSITKVSSRLWRTIYHIESSRLLAFEEACINDFDQTLFFNHEEITFFGAEKRTRWVPHGTSEVLLQRPLALMRRRAIAFLGKMDYQPNVDAVLWFCRHVLPLLPQDVTFLIVGAHPAATIEALPRHHPNVQVTGFMDDPYVLLEECAAMVAPMQTGGGIQNKVLEAMAMGLPVVATERAVRPIIGSEHGRHLLVANTPADMAAGIQRLLKDPDFRTSMGQEARALIAQTFTWDAYERAIVRTIQESMHAKPR